MNKKCVTQLTQGIVYNKPKKIITWLDGDNFFYNFFNYNEKREDINNFCHKHNLDIPIWECIYFIKCLDRIKIGISTNLYQRFNNLVSSNAYELNMIYFHRGNNSCEKELHLKFFDYHINSEWFYYSDEIKEYIINLKELNNHK